MKRSLLLGATAGLILLAFLVLGADVVLADDNAVRANPGDTFPAAMGYAAIAAVTTAGGAMGAAIRHLWKGLRDATKLHQEAIDTLKKDHQEQRDKDRAEYRAELDGLHARLEKEQESRRVEVEKLYNEQKEIMREVMVTCQQISEGFRELAQEIKALRPGE